MLPRDLPQAVLVAEVVRAHGRLFAGLALVPGSMVTVKPRLQVCMHCVACLPGTGFECAL